ncbi:MAG TPA: helix-turn-helix transcriptional regulator [Chthonomonadaceae bacterium]|nr:helix-turn-helix transcriptional regulator [Chthonomonadaceae bacterium]
MDVERELMKGSTQTLILAVLREGARHGYSIAREIERRSEVGLKFKDGSLYPALQALEQGEFIAGVWEPSAGGPPRKVYHITEAGLAELQKRTGDWNLFAQMIQRILKPSRPASES